jgi:hypothetical protein
MRRPAGVYGAHRGDQRLADNLPAIDTLPAILRGPAAEQIEVQFLEVENAEQFLNGFGHWDALIRTPLLGRFWDSYTAARGEICPQPAMLGRNLQGSGSDGESP